MMHRRSIACSVNPQGAVGSHAVPTAQTYCHHPNYMS